MLEDLNIEFPFQESFYSIQGEGISIGKTAYFIRLAGCNLNCWFCDTKETWTVNEQSNDLELISKIESELTERNIDKINSLIFTGGEPTIYIMDLTNFIRKHYEFIKTHFNMIEIETNGSLDISNYFPMFERYSIKNEIPVHFNISPKNLTNTKVTLNSGNYEKFENWLNYDNKIFKFVASNEEDFNEIVAYVNKYNIPNDEVFIMPMGTTKEEILKGQKDLIDLILFKGFNLSTRLHTIIWNNEKGV
jgi:organic radical activating enzyme